VGEATKRRLLVAGRVVFAVAIVVALVLAAAAHADELRDVDLDVRPAWLLLAAPFTLLGGVLLPLAWRHSLGAYGIVLPRATAVRIWSVSQASRFVPGNVALVASRVLLSARHGVAKPLAAGSLALEVGLIVIWGGFFASWLPSTWAPWPLRLLLAVGTLGVLAGLPLVLRPVGRRWPTFAGLRVSHLYEAVGLYGINNLVRATGSLLVAAALDDLRWGDAFLVIGAVNLAAVVGMLGVTPAGLGVREGVIAVLLAHRFGAGNAAAMAVAFRAWEFLFELAWLGVALVWERRGQDGPP
jgi:glycosyltransferase 2 family protein